MNFDYPWSLVGLGVALLAVGLPSVLLASRGGRFRALPGWAAAWGLRYAGMDDQLCLPVSLVATFPLILLSMLEADSAMKPLSLPVVRSMGQACGAWGLFYVESTILLAAAGWIAWQLTARLPLVGAVTVPPLLVATLLVYFRLLGRLAWCCAEAARRAGQHNVEPEDEEA